MSEQKLPSLEHLASRLAPLIEKNADLLAILDYAAGALFCLMEARRLGFRDRGAPCESAYAQRLAMAVREMQAGRPLQPQSEFWIAGLHFNSAMSRIAASYDRMRKSLGESVKIPEKIARIREEVNSLKHNVEGNHPTRQVQFDGAVEGFQELIKFIEERRA